MIPEPRDEPFPPLRPAAAEAKGPARLGAVAASLVLAGAALTVSVLLARFPVNFIQHPDEEIIASLAQRTANGGRWTATWEGFPPSKWWTRPTYQFSPYTLFQSAVHTLLARAFYWPETTDQHVWLARVCASLYGAAAGAVWFLAAYRLWRRADAALLTQALFSVALIHVQNSMYARVETFLSLGIALTAWLSVRAAQGLRSAPALAALLAGVVIATKYNAAPVVLLVVGAVWHHLAVQKAPPLQRCYSLGILLALTAIGFVLATPEMLTSAAPLLQGITYELHNYAGRKPGPHVAFDFWDNNLFYWTRYLTELGFGWAPCCAVVVFLVGAARRRRFTDRWLAPYLLFSLLLIGGTPTRFERNFEVCLGGMALAAADVSIRLVDWLSAGIARWRRGLLLVLVPLLLGQQLLVLTRLAHALRPERSLNAELRRRYPNDDPLFIPPHSEAAAWLKNSGRLVVIFFHSDQRCQLAEARWRAFFSPQQLETLVWEWAGYGYPFSTVEMYHGPAKFMVVPPRAATTPASPHRPSAR